MAGVSRCETPRAVGPSSSSGSRSRQRAERKPRQLFLTDFSQWAHGNQKAVIDHLVMRRCASPRSPQRTEDEGGTTLGRLSCLKDRRTRSIVHNQRRVPTASALLALVSVAVLAIGITRTAVSATGLVNVVAPAAGPSCAWPVSFNITDSKLLILDSSADYWDQPIVAGPGPASRSPGPTPVLAISPCRLTRPTRRPSAWTALVLRWPTIRSPRSKGAPTPGSTEPPPEAASR